MRCGPKVGVRPKVDESNSMTNTVPGGSQAGRKRPAVEPYRGYSKSRTRTALGSYGRPMSRNIKPP